MPLSMFISRSPMGGEGRGEGGRGVGEKPVSLGAEFRGEMNLKCESKEKKSERERERETGALTSQQEKDKMSKKPQSDLMMIPGKGKNFLVSYSS